MNDENAVLNRLLEREGIQPEHQDEIRSLVERIGSYHPETKSHTIRVMLLGAAAARAIGMNPKIMVWAGLHDVGKINIEKSLLEKKDRYNETDYRAMELHALHTWEMLREYHPFTACVTVRCHQYGRRRYPQQLPPIPKFLTWARGLIEQAGRLLCIVDAYDSFVTRDDGHSKKPLTSAEKRERFSADNPQATDLIAILVEKEVFTF